MKILKFGAVWCNGCLVMRPRWKQIEMEHPFLETEYFDYDTAKEYVQKYNIEGGKLPTFIFLDKEGKELHRISGEPSKKSLVELIEKYQNH